MGGRGIYGAVYLPKVVKVLMGLYVLLLVFEVYAEYVRHESLIWFTKPLLMPVLLLIYVSMARAVNWIVVMALAFAWLANISFILAQHTALGLGVFFFLAYRILVFVMVLKTFKWPGTLPVLVGTLPFAFLFVCLLHPIADVGDGQVYIALGQGIIVSVLCGLCIAVWVMYPSKASSLLLVSTLVIASAAFLNQIRLFYIPLPILQPLGMFMFAVGQMLLVIFVVTADENPNDKSLTPLNPTECD